MQVSPSAFGQTGDDRFERSSVVSDLTDHDFIPSSPLKKKQQAASVSTSTFQILNRRRSSSGQLTMDKLRFEKLGLYGRSEEIKMLSDWLAAAERKKQVVFIFGESGTGKTALAQTLRQNVERRSGAFFQGKCELHLGDEPYHCVREACRQICAELITLETRLKDVQDELTQTLGDELILLANIVPQLEEIVMIQTATERDESMQDVAFTDAKNRFNYAFRRFMRIVSSYISPLVLMIDDLQWSDSASLDLLELLLSDADVSNLMLIGCYRSNEVVDEEHRLTKWILSLKDWNDDLIELNEVSLGNLSVTDVNRLLVDLLSDDEPRTLGLAEICQRKTVGNPFFLVQFLSVLHANRLLDFNMTTFKWTWTESEIEVEAAATENVVQLVHARMMKLPKRMIPLLELAACLGHEFDISTLRLVWEALLESEASSTPLDGSVSLNGTEWSDGEFSLNSLVEYGILEKVGERSTRYRWLHDKLQESALNLVPAEKLQDLKARVGNILVLSLGQVELDASIFIAVDLLNQGVSPSDPTERIRLAEHNLRAAQKAVQFSAFQSAYTYCHIGIDALPDSRWESCLDLSLSLYLLAAEVASYLGKPNRTNELCEEILRQEQCDITSKLRAYSILIEDMANGGKRQEAIDLTLEVLEKCGCAFPRNPIIIKLVSIVGVLRAKRTAKSALLDDLSQLPTINDKLKIETLRLLNRVTTYLYLSKNPLMALTILKAIKMTYEDGLCGYSALSFTSMGTLLCGLFFDFQTGSLYARRALRLLEETNDEKTVARTTFVSYYFPLCWTNPLHTLLRPLTAGYHSGMKTGDVESAFFCIWGCLNIALQAGRPLSQLEADCRMYLKQMKEFKKNHHMVMCSLLFQGVLNLMKGGSSGNPTTLAGEACSEDAYTNQTSVKGTTLESYFYYWKTFLFTLFGEFEEAANIAAARGDVALKTSPCSPWLMTDFYFRGIALFAMARRTGKGRYARQGKKHLNRIRSWYNKGCPNVTHLERLLQAELWAYRGNKLAAKNDYETAFVLASRGGFIHDAAFVNERYGEFLLDEMDDNENGVFKLKEAVKLYEEWGSQAKAVQLTQKYGCLWSHLPLVLTVPASLDEPQDDDGLSSYR